MPSTGYRLPLGASTISGPSINLAMTLFTSIPLNAVAVGVLTNHASPSEVS